MNCCVVLLLGYCVSWQNMLEIGVQLDIPYPVSSNHGVSAKCMWLLPYDVYCKAYV